jgi:endonuclease/exonuclease/phosphatase family metal-dependent hydrolase
MSDFSLRVMTWNIHGRSKTNVKLLASIISNLTPDIIGLQEIQRRQSKELADHLKMSHIWIFKHNPFWPLFPGRAEGLAILSRFPIHSADNLVLSTSAHQRSHKRRVAISANIQIDNVTVGIINAHLASHGNAAERLQQAHILRRHIDEQIGHPWILTADLNDFNQPAVLSILEGADAHDAWISHHDPFEGFTCPSSQPRMRLDHIVVSQSFTIHDAIIPTPTQSMVNASDHLPVIAVTHVLGSSIHNS